LVSLAVATRSRHRFGIAVDEQESGEGGRVPESMGCAMAAYDSDLVMHPATDTDKAAVSSVSRNGLAHTHTATMRRAVPSTKLLLLTLT
jgi:hypothetical protein